MLYIKDGHCDVISQFINHFYNLECSFLSVGIFFQITHFKLQLLGTHTLCMPTERSCRWLSSHVDVLGHGTQHCASHLFIIQQILGQIQFRPKAHSAAKSNSTQNNTPYANKWQHTSIHCHNITNTLTAGAESHLVNIQRNQTQAKNTEVEICVCCYICT